MRTPRPHARTRRAAATLLIAVAGLVSLAGCDPRTLFYFLQPFEPTDRRARAGSLEGKKVVLVTHAVSGAHGRVPVDRPRPDPGGQLDPSREGQEDRHRPIRDKVWAWVEGHPNWTDPAEIAKAFEADIVIFLEIEAFQIQNPGDLNVLQGTAKTHIQVTEMDYPKNTKGKPINDQPKEAKTIYDEYRDTEFPVRGPIPIGLGRQPGRVQEQVPQGRRRRDLLALRRALARRQHPGREVQQPLTIPGRGGSKIQDRPCQTDTCTKPINAGRSGEPFPGPVRVCPFERVAANGLPTPIMRHDAPPGSGRRRDAFRLRRELRRQEVVWHGARTTLRPTAAAPIAASVDEFRGDRHSDGAEPLRFDRAGAGAAGGRGQPARRAGVARQTRRGAGGVGNVRIRRNAGHGAAEHLRRPARPVGDPCPDQPAWRCPAGRDAH